MKLFLYKTIKDGVVIRKGVLEGCFDVDIELLTGLDTCSDRCLWDVQSFLDRNYSDEKIVFEYVEFDFDFDKWFEEGDEK